MTKPGNDISTETERVRSIQDKTAPRYDRQMSFFDRLLFADGRQWACSQAQGEVLEIAVGTGRNLAHYPAGTRLTGIELSSEMLAIARRRATDLGINVDLRQGDAQALEFADDSFDTVVITLALCTIPDDRGAVREVRRVLRPGGTLVLLEHVRSPATTVRAVQRLLDPLSVRFEADHLVRDPLDYLAAEGLEIEAVQRLKWGIVERVRARKPTAASKGSRASSSRPTINESPSSGARRPAPMAAQTSWKKFRSKPSSAFWTSMFKRNSSSV